MTAVETLGLWVPSEFDFILFIYLFIFKFIYFIVFIFGCVGSPLLHAGFL